LTDQQKRLLVKALPSSITEPSEHFLIDKLFEVRFANKLTKAYTNVNLNELQDDDIAVDISGYHGKFHREKVDERKLIPIKFEEIV